MKFTTIEEAHDIATLKLDELFGSLCTFKLIINNKGDKKGKDVAFQSINNEELPLNKEKHAGKNLTKSIAMLTKQFSNVVQ